MECARTHRQFDDYTDGIWDDGEWISWDWISSCINDDDEENEFPLASRELVQMFEDLRAYAAQYRQLTGRYLPIFGELGELYAEMKYGITRHAPMTRGSDGRLGNDWVEVKTITPEKSNETVKVKRAGNFNRLVVVKIDAGFGFEAKMVDRKILKKGTGKRASLSWSMIPENGAATGPLNPAKLAKVM